MSAASAATGCNLWGVKMQAEAREQEEKTKLQRKRGAIVLMLHFLLEHGYLQSLEKVQQETGVSLQKVCVADNIDLLSVLQDYEEYIEFKFGHKPKFYRPIQPGDAEKPPMRRHHQLPSLPPEAGSNNSSSAPPSSSSSQDNVARGSGRKGAESARQDRATTKDEAGKPVIHRGNAPTTKASGGKEAPASKSEPASMSDAWVTGLSCFDVGGGGKHASEGNNGGVAAPTANSKGGPVIQRTQSQPVIMAPSNLGGGNPHDDFYEQRLLKPLPDFGWNAELRELASLIQRDILVANPDVKFTDIAQLDNCKLLLKEAVIMPIKYPQFFTGLLRPWRGVLLFGPPGTGKTMLAKAVATECKTTFFNISASTIVSKWRGDSEKLVRMLFDLARHHAPSTIFMDEIDSVMGRRTSSGTEHEGSRRLKTELMVQMDGLNKSPDQVFVMAASNVPWDLDPAILRRLEKRIHVGLPTPEARQQMFRRNLQGLIDEATIDFAALAHKTDGYSGSDIDVLCREAAMRTVRAKIAKLDSLTNPAELQKELVSLDKVTMNDLLRALTCTKSAASSIPDEKYRKWEAEFGAGVVVEDYEDQ